MKTSRRQFLVAAAGAAAGPALLPELGAAPAPPPQLADLGIDWGYSDDAVRVGLNENPLGPSPRAARAMAEAVWHGNRYLRSGTLTGKLAGLHGVEPEWITYGCGSTELLTNIPWAFATDTEGAEIVTGKEAYRDLPNEAERMEITTHMVPLDGTLTHDLDRMADAINERTRVVNVTNPNNPTGTVVPADELRKFAAVVPKDAVYLIDEAYIHFAPEADASSLVHEHSNVVILRTFSKIFGMAGIRIGYAVGHPDLLDKLRRHAVRNNVNVAAFAGALAALDDREHMERYRSLLDEARRYFDAELRAMGIEYVPSRAPFFLIDTRADGEKVVEALEEHGVFTRRGRDWDLPRHVRISYGTMEDNRKVIAALKAVLPASSARGAA